MSNQYHMDGGRRAFSLIELLVSISIIAMLIGILLPALPRARDAARRAACGVNMRSVGQAIELYKNQYREVFPKAKYMPDPWLSGSKDPGFNVAMIDFLERESPAYKCPGDREVFNIEWQDESTTPPTTRKGGMSYTYVTALAGERVEQTFLAKYLKLTPSNTPLMYDFDNGAFETQKGQSVTVSFFHRSRNVLFADGHVGKYDKEGNVD